MTYTLITGASSGIGREFAKIFAKDHHDLVLVSMGESKLVQLKAELEKEYGISVIVIPKDLTATDAVKEVLEKIKSENAAVDILINSAGFGDYGGFLDSDWKKQKNMVDLNITALMQMSYVFGNEMREQGHGRILNMASLAAFSAGPYMSVYYASKAFVLSFSQALTEELKDHGITVTALCPGPTATGFEAAAGMKGRSKMFTSMGVASPADVAETGYKALMSGKAVAYHGAQTKTMNIGSRLSPRSWTRRYAERINGVPKK